MQETAEQRTVDLPRPGPIGLAARVFWAAVVIFGLVMLLRTEPFGDLNPIVSPTAGGGVRVDITVPVITLFVALRGLPDVFNITFGRRWGTWPLVVFVAGAAALALGGFLVWREIWNPALAGWVYAGDLLVMGALAISFPVAIVTRSPGCELGVIPWLLARARGGAPEAHPCSVGLDRIDRWEASRRT